MTATAYDLLLTAAADFYARADEPSLQALGDAARTFDAQRGTDTETALCVLKRTDFGKNAQKPQ